MDAIIIPSASSVFADCALGLSLQGVYSGDGRGWRRGSGVGCHSRTQEDRDERGVLFLAAAHLVLSRGAQNTANELRLAF